MPIAIQGIGVLGAFGTGVSRFEAVLRSHQPEFNPAMASLAFDRDRRPYYRVDTGALLDFVPKKNLRRIDHLGKMALLAAWLALKDAGQIDSTKKKMGVVVASGYGASRTTFAFLDSVIDHGDPCASPTHFSNSVHNAAAAHIAILLGSTGPNLTVSQFDRSFSAALLVAMQWLNEERVASVLVGGVDEYCQVLGYCWNRFFGSEPEPGLKPLNPPPGRTIIGEGASFLYLTREENGFSLYGFLEKIQIGSLPLNQPVIPADTVTVINTDGRRAGHRRYTRHMPCNQDVVTYASRYGSIPVGMGFDVTAAGLAIKTDTVFPTASAHTASHVNLIDSEQRLGNRNICCLQVNASGQFSVVVLNRNPTTEAAS